MSTQISNYCELVNRLPADTVVTFHDVSWEEYEDLLEQVREANGLRISYDDGTLHVMTLSPTHENYARFIETLIAIIRLRLRINIRSFGSTTMRKRKQRKGNEPDASFYVQTAAALGNRMEINFETDPPPDVAVEIDVHHDSLGKLPIYAGLGIPELWRYDEIQMTICHLQEGQYVKASASRALPMLTSQILTEFLTRLPKDGELETSLAFDQWLQAEPPPANA